MEFNKVNPEDSNIELALLKLIKSDLIDPDQPMFFRVKCEMLKNLGYSWQRILDFCDMIDIVTTEVENPHDPKKTVEMKILCLHLVAAFLQDSDSRLGKIHESIQNGNAVQTFNEIFEQRNITSENGLLYVTLNALSNGVFSDALASICIKFIASETYLFIIAVETSFEQSKNKYKSDPNEFSQMVHLLAKLQADSFKRTMNEFLNVCLNSDLRDGNGKPVISQVGLIILKSNLFPMVTKYFEELLPKYFYEFNFSNLELYLKNKSVKISLTQLLIELLKETRSVSDAELFKHISVPENPQVSLYNRYELSRAVYNSDDPAWELHLKKLIGLHLSSRISPDNKS